MIFRWWRQFHGKMLTLTVLGAVVLASFQNCGSGSGAGGLASLGTGVNSLLASKPMPVAFNLNEFSYMSCPQPTTSAVVNADPLSNPFYRIRFGSFDNSYNNGFTINPYTGAAFSATAPLNQNAIGGLAFTGPAMSYMSSINPTPTAQQLTNFLANSPYTSSSQPVAALINQYRTPSVLSSNVLATQLMMPLSNAALTSALVSAPAFPATGGLLPMGYFPTLPPGSNSLTGSISWGASIADEYNFRTNLMNEYIFAGFAPTASTSAASIIQTLESPDNSPVYRLFGYGYKLAFNNNDPSLASVYEYDMSQSTPLVQGNQNWDCFALTVVRDVDRKYWTVSATPSFSFNSTFLTTDIGNSGSTTTGNTNATIANGKPLHPIDVNTVGQANPNLQVNYLQPGSIAVTPNTTNDIPYVMFNLQSAYYPAAHALNSAVTPIASNTFNGNVNSINGLNLYMGGNGSDGGSYFPCPPEDPTTLKANPLAQERLRIIRRFLPAELWEVNVTLGCAVPTAQTSSIGSCYASGDTDQTKFIQYNGIPQTSCGVGMTECPAKISFCWRYQ